MKYMITYSSSKNSGLQILNVLRKKPSTTSDLVLFILFGVIVNVIPFISRIYVYKGTKTIVTSVDRSITSDASLISKDRCQRRHLRSVAMVQHLPMILCSAPSPMFPRRAKQDNLWIGRRTSSVCQLPFSTFIIFLQSPSQQFLHSVYMINIHYNIILPL